MKRFLNLFLVLMMVIGLTGCDIPWLNPNPDPKPNPEPTDGALTLQELWDYLDDYPCYLTDNELDDYVVVFDDEHNITIDNFNVLEKETINYYFNMLDSFSYEGDDIYKLEYINTYEDRFNNGTFFIKFNKETKDQIEVGMYFNNTLEYYDLHGDVGLTMEELICAISKHVWLQETALTDWFVRIDDNWFSHGLVASSYWFYGPVSKLNYLGKFLYEITIEYPTHEEGINPANDAYTTTHLLIYDPVHKRLRFIDHDDNFHWYSPDRAATLEEFYATTSGYIFVGNHNTRYQFFKKDGRYYIKLIDTKENLYNIVEVKSIKYNNYNQYEFTIVYGHITSVWTITYNFRSGFEMIVSKPNLYDHAVRILE